MYATNEDSSDATRGTFSKVDLRGEPRILWEVVVGNRPSEVLVDDETKEATVIVPDDQLSLAIGRDGQNARLAARLTGWRIDIRSDEASQPANA